MEWLVAGWVIVLLGMGLVAMRLLSQRQSAQRVRSEVRVTATSGDRAKAARGDLNA